MEKMVSCEFWKSAIRGGARQEWGRSGGDGDKIEVNTRAVFRGQNELIDEFKITVDDVISIFGICTFQQELKGSW